MFSGDSADQHVRQGYRKSKAPNLIDNRPHSCPCLLRLSEEGNFSSSQTEPFKLTVTPRATQYLSHDDADHPKASSKWSNSRRSTEVSTLKPLERYRCIDDHHFNEALHGEIHTNRWRGPSSLACHASHQSSDGVGTPLCFVHRPPFVPFAVELGHLVNQLGVYVQRRSHHFSSLAACVTIMHHWASRTI